MQIPLLKVVFAWINKERGVTIRIVQLKCSPVKIKNPDPEEIIIDGLRKIDA